MKFFAIAAAVVALSSTQLTPEHERIAKILQTPPKTQVVTIEYREGEPKDNVIHWYIKDTKWRARLHPADIYDSKLVRKDKEYKVTGVILDQGYGRVNIWVKKLEYPD